jgi:hypothetical protein
VDSRGLWRYGLEWGREEVQGLGKVQRGAYEVLGAYLVRLWVQHGEVRTTR